MRIAARVLTMLAVVFAVLALSSCAPQEKRPSDERTVLDPVAYENFLKWTELPASQQQHACQRADTGDAPGHPALVTSLMEMGFTAEEAEVMAPYVIERCSWWSE